MKPEDLFGPPRNGKRSSKSSGPSPSEINEMLDAYIEAALWSSTDESDERGGDPMDKNYGPSDLARETRAKMKRDVTAFARANANLIYGSSVKTRYGNWAQAGHDFWLTRNGHGAGFWDGDWPEPAATKLTDASRAAGHVDLYVHRKRIYQSP